VSGSEAKIDWHIKNEGASGDIYENKGTGKCAFAKRREKYEAKKRFTRRQPSVVSREILGDGALQGPPLPQRGEGRVDFAALAPLGERVARVRRIHQPGRAG